MQKRTTYEPEWLQAPVTTRGNRKRQIFLNTGDAWLVECSRSDTIWAWGVQLENDKRFDTSNRCGTESPRLRPDGGAQEIKGDHR